LKNPNIKFVFVLPRNKFYCSYTLNDNTELHSKKYDDMYQFLVNLLPKKSNEINKLLLYLHKPFFVDIINNKVEELKFDFTQELSKLRGKLRSYNMSQIIGEINKKNIEKIPFSKQQRKFDSFFKRLSNFKFRV